MQYALDERAIPVGGTSAGMAVLGGIDYTGRYSSPDPHKDLVDADDVMQDPTGRFVALVGEASRGEGLRDAGQRERRRLVRYRSLDRRRRQ